MISYKSAGAGVLVAATLLYILHLHNKIERMEGIESEVEKVTKRLEEKITSLENSIKTAELARTHDPYSGCDSGYNLYGGWNRNWYGGYGSNGWFDPYYTAPPREKTFIELNPYTDKYEVPPVQDRLLNATYGGEVMLFTSRIKLPMFIRQADMLTSDNGKFHAIMQPDCNFVGYRIHNVNATLLERLQNMTEENSVWASRTNIQNHYNNAKCFAAIEEDLGYWLWDRARTFATGHGVMKWCSYEGGEESGPGCENSLEKAQEDCFLKDQLTLSNKDGSLSHPLKSHHELLWKPQCHKFM